MMNAENTLADKEKINWKPYLIFSICLLGLLICLIFLTLLPSLKQYQAMNCMIDGDYLQAYNLYKELDDFGDSKNQLEISSKFLYHHAVKLLEKGEYEKTLEYFLALGKYSDAQQRIEQVAVLLDDEVLLKTMQKLSLELSKTSEEADYSALHAIARAYLEGEWITCSGFSICDRQFDSIEQTGEKIYISKDMEIRTARIPVDSLQPTSASGMKLSASSYDVDSFSIDLISGKIYVCYQKGGSSFEGHVGNFRGSLKKSR